MKQTHYIYVFLLLLVSATFPSCIQDNLSDCISDKRIYFNYEQSLLSQKSKGIDPDDIARMNLFVFDENGLFIKEYVDETPQIGPDYFMTVTDLKSGYYRFVAWGNLKEHYAISSALIAGQTTFEELRISLECIKNDEVEDELTSLFFATHTGNNTIEVLQMNNQFIRLDLVKNTYKINMTVSGMDSTLTAKYDYKVNIADNNGIYKFDNDFAACRDFVYTQPCTINKEQNGDLESSITVLRLTADRQPLLSLVNKQTGEVVVKENLVELIQAVNEMGASIDFKKTYEFDIRYELNRNSPAIIVIYVNGWKLIRQSGELN
ncbi:MAG: FimB/Mfa2 family fimbrial subunit [Tannerellaceae bacterium]|jgi:hypothetical protein|nr:FimB/Mfa2 family fimbrial subunit [Tannerellaceae bacterium]